jgi:Flp pilus assembly protein CpaB
MTVIRRLTTTRQGTLVLAGIAALLAMATLTAFLHGYKKTLADNAQPVTVLVAKEPLPKGSSGDLIARKGLFQATGFKREQVKDGAITDPGSLSGLVATHDIVRGEQLTTADFAKPTDPVLSKLGPDERAISIPLDSAHGIIGRVAAGDHVDVLAGFQVQPDGTTRPRPVLRTLLQNVEVLQAPPATDAAARPGTTMVGQTQNVVLKVPEARLPELAFASDNGKVWIALRAQAGATQHRMSIVTLDQLLLGMNPIPVDRFLAHKRTEINKILRGEF